MVFKLDAVLSVITGINLGLFLDTCRLMDHMVGDGLTDTGRLMMQPKCREALLAQFPALTDAVPPDNIADVWREWMTEQRERFGDAFDVQPIAVAA